MTDHNTNTHHEELDRLSHLPIVLIPGEEVTTYWGHANMWGLREWIDFRCADEDSIQAVRKYVLRKGGLISVNHPKSVGPPWLFRGWEGYPAMEVWQAPWRFHNWESLERWDALLRKGERVVAVGGSDVALDPARRAPPPPRPRQPDNLGLRRGDQHDPFPLVLRHLRRAEPVERPHAPSNPSSTPSAPATSTSPTPPPTRSSSSPPTRTATAASKR